MEFLALSDEKALCFKLFVNLCDFTHSSIHIARRFVIQGFSTSIDQVSAISTHLFVTLLPHNVISKTQTALVKLLVSIQNPLIRTFYGYVVFWSCKIYLPIICKFKYLIDTEPLSSSGSRSLINGLWLLWLFSLFGLVFMVDLSAFSFKMVHSVNLCLCCSLVTLTSIYKFSQNYAETIGGAFFIEQTVKRQGLSLEDSYCVCC